MKTAAHPPRTRFALRVGVTGHRPKDLAKAQLDTLREKIREVLEFLQSLVAGYKQHTTYTNPGKPIMRLISALAEGADRISAEQALALGFELQAPLPFTCDEYIKDFETELSIREFSRLLETATAVLELDGSREREADSYLAAGRLILSQSDILLAIWNGEDRQKKGGTSDIVSEAGLRKLPIVWIDARAPHSVYVRLADGGWKPWAVGAAAVGLYIEAMLNPPEAALGEAERGTRPEDYWGETQPRMNWGFLWIPFRDLACGCLTKPSFLVQDFRAGAEHDWQNVLQSSSAFDDTLEPLRRTRLLEHYGWIHGLADYYGNLYRSAFLGNYLLGALAVCLAFLHYSLELERPDAAFALNLAELGALLWILLVYGYGRRRRWHERWLDYRLLAEYLRQLVFLIPLGPGELSAPHLPAHISDGDARNTWMHWHYSAIRREIGMISGTFNHSQLQAILSFLLDNSGIQGQIEYHHNNARRLAAADSTFRSAGTIFFALAFFGALGAAIRFLHPHVFVPLASSAAFEWANKPPVWSALLAGFATVCPALGAALSGIRSQAEFERVAKRSRAMSVSLKRVHEALENLRSSGRLSSQVINTIVADAGQLMIDELLDWRIVFRARNLPEPE